MRDLLPVLHRPRGARAAVLRGLPIAVVIVGVLAGCSSVRLDPPAPVTAPALLSDDERYPAPQPRVWTQPPVETPLPALAEPAAQAAPVAAAAPAQVEPVAPTSGASVDSAAAATTAASVATTAPPAAAVTSSPAPSHARIEAARARAPTTRALAPPAAGRWSVQVGVFAVEANADALRDRVAARLPGSAVRTVRRDARVHVLVGDAPDRVAALQLAQQLRASLQQDVVLFRW